MKNSAFMELNGINGIKKLLIFIFVAALFISAPTASFASEDTADVISENTDEFFDTIVNPMFIPCDYWPDANHRYNTGNVNYEEVYSHPHNHYDPGTGITHKGCEVYNVYRVSERVCNCGDKSILRTKQEDRHYH